MAALQPQAETLHHHRQDGHRLGRREGRTDAALDNLERALLADPDLELDPAVTSPKLMAVFYVARGSAASTR